MQTSETFRRFRRLGGSRAAAVGLLYATGLGTSRT